MNMHIDAGMLDITCAPARGPPAPLGKPAAVPKKAKLVGMKRELSILLADHKTAEDRAFFKAAVHTATLEAERSVGGGGALRSSRAQHIAMLPNMFGEKTTDDNDEDENNHSNKRARAGDCDDDEDDAPAAGWHLLKHTGMGSQHWQRRAFAAGPLSRVEGTGAPIEQRDVVTLGAFDFEGPNDDLFSDPQLQPRPPASTDKKARKRVTIKTESEERDSDDLDEIVTFGRASTLFLFELVARFGSANFVAVHDRFLCHYQSLGESTPPPSAASPRQKGHATSQAPHDVVGLKFVSVADATFRYWAVARRALERRASRIKTLLLNAHSTTITIPDSVKVSLVHIINASPILSQYTTAAASSDESDAPAAPSGFYTSYAVEVERRRALQEKLRVASESNTLYDAHKKRLDEWKGRLEVILMRCANPELAIDEANREAHAFTNIMHDVCSFIRIGSRLDSGKTIINKPQSYMSEIALLSFGKEVNVCIREVEEAMEKYFIGHHQVLSSVDPIVVVLLEKVRVKLCVNNVLKKLSRSVLGLELVLVKLNRDIDAVLELPDDQVPQ